MNDSDAKDVRDFWNSTAKDWRTQVGDEGDANRRLNSDPVLWQFAGDVAGRAVLDAGCGTGYLTNKLHERGARVTGIDLSEQMIELARATYPELEFRVDSISELRTADDEEFEIAIANYVLMDTSDLAGAMQALHRVLTARGVAVLVFSHPCFPQGRTTVSEGTAAVSYTWDFPYFEQRRCADPPWGHFTTDFIWFHRPLSDYWKAFVTAGFAVIDFEEPRITEDRYPLADSEKQWRKLSTRPYSVAFKLRKESEYRHRNGPRRFRASC